jgi:hypothetical protein
VKLGHSDWTFRLAYENEECLDSKFDRAVPTPPSHLPSWKRLCQSHPVNSNKIGTITVGKHAHTYLKPTVRGNCTFKRTKESFEEWEIQSKFIFDENEQEKSFFI